MLAIIIHSEREENIRFGHDVTQIGSVETITHLHYTLKIDFALGHHGTGMNLENFQTANLIRQRNFDLSVQTSSTKKSWVESIGPIRSHDNLCLSKIIETVELVEQFH
ncbi:hypothetical protein DPV78_004391 [Talaromyces pinophilus]|nr:hypothetical protein DPV78_004391 [Talaromyces pinophilus]